MDIPALVGLTLLSEAGADIFVQQMKLVSPSWSADLVFMHGHLYVSKPSSKSIQMPEVFYSRRTLEDIHKTNWDMLLRSQSSDSSSLQSQIPCLMKIAHF
jgi:predicted SnoaL-like aldol condensation-catalyzing enzyme